MSDGKLTLNLSETNELMFKMRVKGSNKEPSSVRLVFEGPDYSYSVRGRLCENDMYRFIVPKMEDRGLDEGIYDASVEVIVDGRHFAPVNFEAQFIRPIQVQVESAVFPVNSGAGSRNLHRQSQPVVEAAMAPVTARRYSSLREKYKTEKKF